MDAAIHIVTNSSSEFFAAIDTAKREKQHIVSVTRGKTNGQWVIELLPGVPTQPELICAGLRPDNQTPTGGQPVQ